MIAGSQKADSGSKTMLLLVVCEPEEQVTEDHINYLLKAGREKDVNSVWITHNIEITKKAQKLCEKYSVDLLSSEEIQSNTQSNDFDMDTDEISIPNSHSNSEINSTHNVSKEIHEIYANFTQSDEHSVGGKLILNENSLQFEPNIVENFVNGEKVEMSYNEVQNVGRKKKFSGSVTDTIYGGGLRDRLKIEKKDGNELLFVVSDIDGTIDKIKRLRQSDQVSHQSPDDHFPKVESESENMNYISINGCVVGGVFGLLSLTLPYAEGLDLFELTNIIETTGEPLIAWSILLSVILGSVMLLSVYIHHNAWIAEVGGNLLFLGALFITLVASGNIISLSQGLLTDIYPISAEITVSLFGSIVLVPMDHNIGLYILWLGAISSYGIFQYFEFRRWYCQIV